MIFQMETKNPGFNRGHEVILHNFRIFTSCFLYDFEIWVCYHNISSAYMKFSEKKKIETKYEYKLKRIGAETDPWGRPYKVLQIIPELSTKTSYLLLVCIFSMRRNIFSHSVMFINKTIFSFGVLSNRWVYKCYSCFQFNPKT